MPKFTGSTVELRSVEPYFTAERTGRKPNTLRQMTDTEYAATLVCERVRVVGPDGAAFEREITSVFDVNDIFELLTCDRLVVISWKHNPAGERETTFKACPMCEKRFDVTEATERRKFCSDKCRAKAHYRKRRWGDDGSDDTSIYAVSDDDLPGMWSRSDFEGGQDA